MRKKVFLVLSALLIVALTSIIYSNTLNVPFQFDDVKRLVGIKAVESINIKEIFQHSKSRFLLFLTFAINYFLGGYNVFGYHLINLVIHTISSIVVFLLYLSIFDSPRFRDCNFKKEWYLLSFFSALIFAVHPLQTESVTYIYQRGESMAGLFYFMALLLYAKFRKSWVLKQDGKNGIIYYILCFVSIIFCSLTKPSSASLPVAILMYELFFMSTDSKEFKSSFKYLIPILSCIIFPFLLAKYDIGESKDVGVRLSPYYMPYYYTKLRVLATAIRLMFLPINQTLAYDFELSTSLGYPISTFYSFLLHLCLAVFAVFSFRRYPFVSFSIGWFYLTLLGTTVLYLDDLFFEHYLYLALFGYAFLLLILTFNLITKRHIDKKWAVIFFIILSIIYCIGTYNRNKVWQTEIALWEDAVKKSPAEARANYTLGVYYFRAKRYEDALKRYKLALVYKPAYPEAYYRIGEYYFISGEIESSIANYKKALEIKPDFFEAYMNLGSVYLNLRRYKDAEACFSNALTLTDDVAYKEKIGHMLDGLKGF